MRASREAFIAEFSGSQRDVAMFLTHDVLARQAPDIQDFLLRTSILDRFCLGLVEAVCPGRDCAAALAAIEQSNLFLIALDPRDNGSAITTCSRSSCATSWMAGRPGHARTCIAQPPPGWQPEAISPTRSTTRLPAATPTMRRA
ncbi:hypothetical protein ACVOMV_15355 [Mesorhizobium atlanticum]